MRQNDPMGTEEVGKIKTRRLSKVRVGKPSRVVTSAMRSKVANFGSFGGSVSGGGFGYQSIPGNTVFGSGGNFYSPELSTDFLELPQSLDEMRNYFRFFYENDPFVGRAIDTHTEIPLSKLRFGIPQVRDPENRPIAEMALNFCKKWAKKVNLLQRLISICHEYNLIGEVFIWVEDSSPDMPKEVRYEQKRVLDPETEIAEEVWVEREDADKRAYQWLKKNFKGWDHVQCLPPEQVHMESFPFTREKLFEFVLDGKTKNVVEQASQGDISAKKIVDSYPPEIIDAVRNGRNIFLNTDPDAGSFIYYMANKKSDYETRGKSMLQRCIRVLIYRDKLRQAQTSIASRHMTPMRVISAVGSDIQDIEDLRDQVDYALQDPDYSIVTNYEINWDEMGSDQRLLDLSSEYDLTDRQLYAGLGVTESLLSGESSYSGDRINLLVINTRYMLMRELFQDFVERYLFEPMCRRMGFIETYQDEFGFEEEEVLVPSLSFTRLGIYDNQEVFDALFNLYQKGSLDVDTILELLNIDPVATREKIERDAMTWLDPNFNEIFRSMYSRIADSLAEHSDAAEKIAELLDLSYEKPEENTGGRF